MIVEGNGLRIDVYPSGNTLRYVVLSQTPEVTQALRLMENIPDEQTGYSLRSNRKPFYKESTKRFYVRGCEVAHDNKEVTVNLKSPEEVKRAISALERMVAKLVCAGKIKPANHNVGNPETGGTSHIRFAVITRDMAKSLELTSKKYYPDIRDWPGSWCKKKLPIEPIYTVNTHYNEHMGQAVDVLNKSAQYKIMLDAGDAKGIKLGEQTGVTNPHKVTPKQAYQAHTLLKKCFDEAHEQGFLVAWWRIVTGIRGPDFKD